MIEEKMEKLEQINHTSLIKHIHIYSYRIKIKIRIVDLIMYCIYKVIYFITIFQCLMHWYTFILCQK